ncbi:MAG: type I methionyl aminopeptidase [Bacteroidales bacterium]|jgi:methionyl aminopeptidase|nr:type I methionyl aminopeptidase [Bacteroidales bacterium]
MSKIIIKTEEQIEGIRQSCQLAGKCLQMLESYVKEGVSTGRIDMLISEYIRDHHAKAATLGYNGYPKSSCISVNDVVCHGIPAADVILRDGDILNIDITTILNGYFGDTSRMYSIGTVTAEAQRLIAATKHCLELGIREVYPGNRFGNIGFVINRYARSQNYTVVYEYCGHGVGLQFHEDPQVDHVARRDSGELMKPGMVFTIEPMINAGKSGTKLDKSDGWTARTKDGKLSAQYEHTVLVTSDGVDVLSDVEGEWT